MIKSIIKINNYFHEKSLEKKKSYNFGEKTRKRKKRNRGIL
jgi:hypothetical protein